HKLSIPALGHPIPKAGLPLAHPGIPPSSDNSSSFAPLAVCKLHPQNPHHDVSADAEPDSDSRPPGQTHFWLKPQSAGTLSKRRSALARELVPALHGHLSHPLQKNSLRPSALSHRPSTLEAWY